MKWMIASDIHGSAVWCERMLGAFQREGADKLLLLGDLLYHGPRNDLPEGYGSKAVIEMLNGAREKIFCVRGNCEAEVDQMVLGFPVLADYCLVEAAGRLVFATHGHHYNVQSPPLLGAGDVLLHGHTHVPMKARQEGGWWYLNPGSVSLPKEGSAHGYMLLDGGVFTWKDLDGREYDSLDVG
ncbi:phosphodiesterase [bacterium D16-76]|nr:phosphodiesterase [bacterium D16-76]